MNVVGIVRKDVYYDSISIMLIAKQISEMEGVLDSAVVMGTKENKTALRNSGLLCPELQPAGDMDLVIAVKLDETIEAGAFSKRVEAILLRKSDDSDAFMPQSIESAISIMPDANLAMISVGGRYAGDLAMQALQRRLHVFLFRTTFRLRKKSA